MIACKSSRARLEDRLPAWRHNCWSTSETGHSQQIQKAKPKMSKSPFFEQTNDQTKLVQKLTIPQAHTNTILHLCEMSLSIWVRSWFVWGRFVIKLCSSTGTCTFSSERPDHSRGWRADGRLIKCKVFCDASIYISPGLWDSHSRQPGSTVSHKLKVRITMKI